MRDIALVFKSGTQSLLDPDPLLVQVWNRLDTGIPVSDLYALCKDWQHGVDEFVQQLQRSRIANIVSLDGTALDVSSTQVLNLYPARIGVFLKGQHSLHALDQAFGHTFSEGGSFGCTLVAKDCRGGILLSTSNAPSEFYPSSELGPAFRAHMTDIVLDELTELAIHGAVVRRGDRRALFVGEPGAGKSVLSLALSLANAGFQVEGDDVAILSDSSLVRAVPFPVTLKSGAWDLFADMLPTLEDRTEYERADGQRVRYLPTQCASESGSGRVSHIFHLTRNSNEVPKLVELDVVETMQVLIASSRSPDDRMSKRHFGAIAGLINGAKVYQMQYSGIADGIRLVTEAFDLAV